MVKKASSAHILVIRLSAMGDVAITIPALLALRKQYPTIKITLLTKPHFKAIFNAVEGISVFPVRIESEHKGIWGLWKLCGELNKLSISHVADLHNVLRSKILSFFFKIKGIPVQKIDKGRKEKKALTRTKHKIVKPLKSTIERYYDVFKGLGFPLNFEAKQFLLKQRLPHQLVDFEKSDSRKYIGIAPFATYNSKMYQLVLIEKVIQRLCYHLNCHVYLFGGGKQEVSQLDTLASKFDNRVENMAGKLPFEAELALMSNLDLMLAMDSGNGHLAANYGIPVVTVWGVTHPYVGFAPYNQPEENSLVPDKGKFPLIPTSVYGNKYPKAYAEAINSIMPQTIVERILNVLDEL